MMRQRTSLPLLLGMLSLGPVAAWAQEAPDVKVSMLPGAAAIAPGQPFEVGIRFEIPAEFHIYWANPGESGFSPSVEWTMPKGFKAGPLRHPAPHQHEVADIISFIHEGNPILLATITPPDDLKPGESVKLTGKVRYLVCKEACFTGEATVSTTLPVKAEPEPLEGDAARTIDRARRALPLTAGESRFVDIEVKAPEEPVDKGQEYDVTLNVKLKPGFHLQSNEPLQKNFIATRLYPQLTEGITFGRPQFSGAHTRMAQGVGRVSEFSGSFQVRLPAKVTGKTDGDSVAINGLLYYQACSDRTGQCAAPEAVQWSTTIKSNYANEPKAETASAGGSSSSGTTEGSHAGGAGTESSGEVDNDGSGVATTEVEGSGGTDKVGFVTAIFFGFIGGLILNIMPCVLPVISIKILSFMQQADEEPRRVFRLGLTFCAGIVVSFWVLAAGILAIQASTGQAQSWGAFFTKPVFVVAMITLMFVFAMNLFGLFEIVLPGRTTTKLASATEREGYTGAFFKGALATLLATPCSAPFLGLALGAALAGTPAQTVAIFTAAGLGMAWPYALLTWKPAWMRFLPKPGNWMIAFKQFMGFLLIGTVVWLLIVVGGLMGKNGLIVTAAYLTLLGLACWLLGRGQLAASSQGKAFGYISGLVVAGAGAVWTYGFWYEPDPPPPTSISLTAGAAVDPMGVDAILKQLDWEKDIPWIAYDQGLAEELAKKGYTVYVDYTAVWCLTCQTNKKVVLESDAIRSQMAELGVVPMKADFTDGDPRISEDLRKFGRGGVPMNLIYPADKPDQPLLLPEVLTKSLVKERLEQAGPSKA